MRISTLAGVLASLLLLERIKEQGQTMILMQLSVHGRLGVTRVRAVKNNVMICGKKKKKYSQYIDLKRHVRWIDKDHIEWRY